VEADREKAKKEQYAESYNYARVVSHSTCPPLSPPFPHANSFVIGPTVINNNYARERFATTAS
jgi:hypothetical protein